MLHATMRRATAILTLLVACALLSGCDGDESGPVTPTAATADRVTVLFQMTGLVLLVPPTRNGGPTEVLLPKDTEMPAPHVAWIGFGLESERPDLCVYQEGGYCYVDLDRWSLDPVGANLQPASGTISSFPDSVLDLTHSSGGRKVRLSAEQEKERVRARVTFRAGRVSGGCSLAKWTHDPYGWLSWPLRVRVANLVDWELWHPRDQPFQLTFRSRTDSRKMEIVPIVPVRDTIALLLVHIPDGEKKDLPPAQAEDPDPRERSDALHYHALYTLLGIEPESSRRRIPRDPKLVRTKACPVRLTSVARGDSLSDVFRGIRTYACMPAAAEPGS